MSPIKLALQTWYAPDSESYRDAMHPALKLAGETGELLDLYAKHLFKPNFNAFTCKNCAEVKEEHNNDGTCYDWYQNSDYSLRFVSRFFDELGDVWYYLRILAFIKEIELTRLNWNLNDDLLYNLGKLNFCAATIASGMVEHKSFDGGWLEFCYRYFVAICFNLGITEEEVTQLNYEKLNIKGAHGWKPSYVPTND